MYYPMQQDSKDRAVLGWLTQQLGDNTKDPSSASSFTALSRLNSEAKSLHSPGQSLRGPTTSKGRKKDPQLSLRQNKLFPISTPEKTSSHSVPGHMSIAGDRNIMIGSAVTNQDFFFFGGFLSLIPHRGKRARCSFYSCGSTSSEGDREEWMLLGGTPPASASLPHLLHLRRVAASQSRVYSPLPPVPVSGSSLCVPSHFKAALRRSPPGGDLGSSVNSQGNEPSRKQIF